MPGLAVVAVVDDLALRSALATSAPVWKSSTLVLFAGAWAAAGRVAAQHGRGGEQRRRPSGAGGG